ncbi:secernin-1 [Camelus ferus]|nr:secernin-1 [Camelus ferus]
MRFFFWNAILTLLVTSLSGALIPEPEVKIEVLQKPFICHRKTKGGDLMLVHYEGYLEKDGSLFHSTHKHNNGQPIWFTLGILEALKGWDQGLKGMCVGEKRKLIIPPALGYGKEGKDLEWMAVAPPSYCFVAFPPRAKDGQVVFGKNSARPRDEVQEVVYFSAADHDPESKVEVVLSFKWVLINVCFILLPESLDLFQSFKSIKQHKRARELLKGLLVCTYISVDQVPRTHAIVISRPAWLWGAEMGANEHGVCIANEAINAREPASETEALLGMDLVRLGLERGTTAKEALDVIVALLEEHGQGGNYYEDANSCHSFQSAFLIVDCEEAWVLETVGKYWAAEKMTESITVQTMIDILRDKASGVCVDSESFLTTASIVSVLPQNRSSPCIHYFTGTPDPSRSIFKPFIFVEDVKLVPKAQSPCFGDDDPAKKEPRFQEKPDRRHELYKAHEWARAVLESDEEQGQKLRKTMLELEKQGLEAMEEILTSSEPLDPTEVGDLFYDCVDTEIKFFK